MGSTRKYLTRETALHGTIELFACWEGDQAEQPVICKVVTPEEIGGESFWFEERQFLVIEPVGDSG
jgi:hypothetical protein